MSGNETGIPIEDMPEEKNLLSDGVRIVGLILMAMSICLALYLGAWVIWNRKSPVVKMMQPIFLLLLCVGTIINNSFLIPAGATDENTENINAACLAVPWLAYTGNTIVLSALFSKLWRVNQIFHAEGFQRKVVTVKDVLWPFLILLGLNLVFLTVMSTVDPPVWIREPVDEINPYNTVGYCGFEGSWGVLMDVLLGLVNFIALVVLCVQAYRANDIKSEFSEARGVALGLFSALQAVIITVPTESLLNHDNADAKHMLLVMQEIVPSVAMLLFIFLPLMSHQRQHVRGRTGSTRTRRRRTTHTTSSDSHGQPRTRTRISGLDFDPTDSPAMPNPQNSPPPSTFDDENHATISNLEMEVQTLRSRITELEGEAKVQDNP